MWLTQRGGALSDRLTFQKCFTRMVGVDLQTYSRSPSENSELLLAIEDHCCGGFGMFPLILSNGCVAENEVAVFDLALGGASKPVASSHCTQHAREWISALFCSYLVEQLLNRQTNGLLRELGFVVLPVMNVAFCSQPGMPGENAMHAAFSDWPQTDSLLLHRLWQAARRPN